MLVRFADVGVQWHFCSKYFDTSDFYWISDDSIDGPLCVNDHFFSLEDMLNYMRYNYGVNKMFEHYNYALDERRRGATNINIKNYAKSNTPK